MTAKPTSERMAAMRERREALGLIRLELWCHPNDVTRIKKDAAAYAARRARLLAKGVVIDSMEVETKRMIAMAKKAMKSA